MKPKRRRRSLKGGLSLKGGGSIPPASDGARPRYKESKFYRAFVISIAITLGLSLATIFIGIAVQGHGLIREELLSRARAHFNSILVTRKWNSNYGGVFVLKTEGVESNPFLENPDLSTNDGRVLTNRTPEIMTREISRAAENEGGLKFHLTSLNPLNPENLPNEWEARALRLFETGVQETFDEYREGKKLYYRYMAPLRVEKSCLTCHAKQGYRVGDIRGGISIGFEFGSTQEKLTHNIISISIAALLTGFLLFGMITIYVLRLKRQLEKAGRQLQIMARTDILTGLWNRGHLLERFSEEFLRARRQARSLGCLLLDLDHFKAVNDRFGHPAGDRVLRQVGAILAAEVRKYDIVGRIGGEEFLIVVTEAPLVSLVDLAERIRTSIEKGIRIEEAPEGFTMTVSIGVADMSAADPDIDAIIKRADDALYRAKKEGRNRVIGSWTP